MKYLYGAAVQGIQEFIFRTNKLSEITGASELVERICTTFFSDVLGKSLEDNRSVIINAAGNIKYIFDDRCECERVVLTFPKYVMQRVPGITLSQAVVEYDPDSATNDFYTAVNELEQNLRIQRNIPSRQTMFGLMGIERSRQTGLPVVEQTKHQDESTIAKKKIATETNHKLCAKAFGKDVAVKNVVYDTDSMVGENDWIAVIHADGNGLGQIVQKIGHDRDKFHSFSINLDKANKEAAQYAFNKIKEKYHFDKNVPIRPIVLSGDDFTVICRADFAMEYALNFIKCFEQNTKQLTEYGLTACAGIAYIKSSFPFYYGYEMAEELCSHAKQDAKKISETAPSCISFLKIEDSFTEGFETIRNRNLTTKDCESFVYGPYYVNDGQKNRWTVETLLDTVSSLNDEDKDSNAVKSHIRQWLSIKMTNSESAQQKLNRVLTTLNSKKELIERLTSSRDGKIPAFDVLSLHSIHNISTK